MSSCDFEHLTETTVGVKQIFEGRIINVHVDDVKLSDGSFSKREVLSPMMRFSAQSAGTPPAERV